MDFEAIINTVRNWLGIGSEYAINRFYLRSHLSPVLLAVLIGAAAAFAWLLYRREAALSRWRRLGLAILRTIVYGLILVIVFQPAVDLERRVAVRRPVLVLVDESRSMGNVDPCIRSEDLAARALAMNVAKFVLPAQQEAAAGAQRAMQDSAKALKGGHFRDALEAQRQAEEALDSALKNGQAVAQGAENSAPPGVARFLTDVGGVAARQKALRAATEDLEKQGAPGADKLRQEQEAIRKDLDEAAAALCRAPVAVPAADRS